MAANISDCDLSGAGLQAAQLRRAFGMRADFRSAPVGDLHVACALFDADFTEAQLQEANLSHRICRTRI